MTPSLASQRKLTLQALFSVLVLLVAVLVACAGPFKANADAGPITIIGDNPYTYTYGDDFVDPGATYVDQDGNIQNADSDAGTHFTSKTLPGSSTISYSDKNGNKATRIVIIAKRPLTLTPVVENKTYDGTPKTNITVGVSNTVNGDSISATGSGDFPDANVGNGKSVQVSVSVNGLNSINYTWQNSFNETADITPVTLVISADNMQINYGDPEPSQFNYTVHSDSLFNGDTLSGTLVRDPGTAAGKYAIKQGTLTAGSNYAIDFTNGVLTINGTSQDITVTQDAPSTAVFGSVFDVAATASTGLAPVITTTGSCSINGGEVTITAAGPDCVVHFNQPGNESTNPASEITETVTTTPAPISASIPVITKSYDGTTDAAFPATATLVGPANGADVQIDISGITGSFDTATVGSGKTVTFAGIALKGTDASDYSIDSGATASGEITKDKQTITFAALSNKVMNSGDFVVTATSTSGLVPTFSATTTSVCTITSTSTVHLVGVGTCTIEADQSGSVIFAAASAVDQAFMITAAPVVVSSGGGGGGGGGGSGFAPTITLPGATTTATTTPIVGQVLGVSTSTVTTAPTNATCKSIITKTLRRGGKNDVTQVKTLQKFLNAELKLHISVTGYFGPLTEAAVKLLQLTYAAQILTPANADKPTGLVLGYTRAFINTAACSLSL